jgi:cell division septation protein DedD
MENRLKQRLTGAAILVALIVMLVPEMFHGQRGNVAAIAGSSGEGPPVRSYTIDLSNSPTRTAPLQSTPVGTGSGATGAASGNDEQPAGAAHAEPSTAATGPAEQDPSAASRSSVQASSAPASAAPAITAPAATAPVAATPATTAPATATAKVGAPPSSAGSRQSAAPTPSHSASGAGWLVQLGLFAKRDNAERLAHSAQAQGFAVSVSNADAKGRYRVYAGAMTERSAADAYAQRLKDHGLSAAVVAAP